LAGLAGLASSAQIDLDGAAPSTTTNGLGVTT